MQPTRAFDSPRAAWSTICVRTRGVACSLGTPSGPSSGPTFVAITRSSR
ncbi:hypothetical protein [Actinacidiphila soli]